MLRAAGENEQNVRYVLAQHPAMALVEQQPYLGKPGLQCSLGSPREEYLTPEQANLVQRFNPDDELDTIGFFIAKFVKCSDVQALHCSTSPSA